MFVTRIANPIVPLCLAASSLLAQAKPAAPPALSVPRFAVAPSPIQIVTDARAATFLPVIGRKAAWLGQETGSAELWVPPLKLATDFALDFQVPDYMQPIKGADVARTVTVAPEMTTITYTHATFTIKEHILAPMSVPGVLVLLDVQTIHPLTIIASFKPVLQYAWPAAFGGQYAFWSAGDKAFILSESLRKRNAVIGSPWAANGSDAPAHMLADQPSMFVIPVDTARAAREFIPIGIVAATAPRDSVLQMYRALFQNAKSLYDEKRAWTTTLLAKSASLDTPDTTLNRALAWSEINLDEAESCNPDLGCGLVAGWGPSGNSTRPGFAWFFGGDAAINSLAMDAAGLWPQVADGLRFLARYQRADGKIPHEISQAAGLIPWFTDFPYAYYHADTTPYWILAVWRYWQAGGDDQLVRDLWPAITKAYQWCLTTETDGDGIIENTTGGMGAIEVGALGENLHEDIYLAGVWIEALQGMKAMAALMGDQPLSDAASALHDKARATLNSAYWRDVEGHFAFGILDGGKTNNNLTAWPATAASFDLFDVAHAEQTLIKLATDSISSDWGAHPLSTGSPLYDPMHYNNGAVWPFVTGFVAWGQYDYRRPWAAYPLVDDVKQLTFDWSPGRHPEVLSGQFYKPLDTAVPDQYFATSMLVTPLLRGTIGWEPDAPQHQARLAPQLPPQWARATVKNLRVGAASVSADFAQAPGRAATTLTAAGGDVTLNFVQSVPAGATGIAVSVDSVVSPIAPVEGRHEQTVSMALPLSPGAPRTVVVTWTGGLSVEPPVHDLTPGQTSHGLRVLDFGAAATGWTLLVEGNAGERYTLKLHGAALSAATGASIVTRNGDVTTIAVSFPGTRGRRAASVTLKP